MSGDLKRGADGQLLHGSGGHLVHSCGSGCCLDCPQSIEVCLPTQWTITFTGVTIDTDCLAAANLAVSTTGALDGTYTVPANSFNPEDVWETTTSNVLWEEDEGDECVTPPDQTFRIHLQDNGTSMTLQVDAGVTAQDLQLFYAVATKPSGYPCASMTFTNSLTVCGTDGVNYTHGCGGTAVVTPC